MVNSFRISGTSDRFWNLLEFVEFLLANQNNAIHLQIDPEAVCLRSLGVYRILESLNFRDVVIDTGNPIEKHSIYQVCHNKNSWFTVIPSIDVSLHQWTQKKLFYALFGRPTAGRLALAAYLKEQHANVSHVHFSATTDIDNINQFEFDKLLSYDKDCVTRAGNLLNQLPLLLSPPDRYTAYYGYDYSDPLTTFYQDILIDVVVESHVFGDTFFPTEKTLRSIWMKKPFVIFASRDYLSYMRQMGFQTFWQFWDENYDGFETRDRLLRILKLLDWFASQSPKQLWDLYQTIQPILNHNYDLLLTQSYKCEISKID